MEHPEVHQTVDDIGQIVRRDGGALDFENFDPSTGELVVAFSKAPNDGRAACTIGEAAACTIDEATVRMFLEEAVKAQGIEMTSLHIRTA